MLRVHHLDCGTFCPPAARLYSGTGAQARSDRLVCHCLLIESDEGLVLVDTGLGLTDGLPPRERLGSGWPSWMRPPFTPERSARRQIEALGHAPDDVRHIIVTHLDVDHAGGLADFPKAKVHVYEPEYEAAMHPATARERIRYKRAHVSQVQAWARYELEGDRWFGFEAVRAMGDLNLDILLIPLSGHSRGHCGVAVRTSEGWLLHAGDAYFHHGELRSHRARAPMGLRLYADLMAVNPQKRRANTARLRELARQHAADVTIFCSHDPWELDAFRLPEPVSSPLHPELGVDRQQR